MKKRIVSTLLALCMLLCLVPTTVFAEGEAAPELAAVQENVLQPGETAVQPATVNTTLADRAAGITKTVSSWGELADALADANVDVIQLAANGIYPWGNLHSTLYVERAVTLDLNGYVLKGDGRSVFEIKDGGHLTVADSRPKEEHKFWVNNDYSYGVWRWNNESGDKIAYGGVINGGYTSDGGGVKVHDGGRLTMNGGSIVGCGSSGGEGGGVYVYGGGAFEMNDGTAIIGCAAQGGISHGGGVYVAENGTFTMNGGTIRDCVTRGWGGGGVASEGQFTMNGGTIESCSAVTTGGAIYHSSGAALTLNGTITSDNSSNGQPVYVQGGGAVTIGADADIRTNVYLSDCTLRANGGTVRGDLYANWDIRVSVDEGVTSGTIFYGKLTGNCEYRVDGVAVRYKLNGGDYATQFLRSGSTAAQPVAPTVPEDQNFDGWFKGDSTRWDFTTAVTEDTTLAGWLYTGVGTETELDAVLADNMADVIRLTGDIDIETTLNIARSLTLDLNGHVLKMTGSGSVFKITSTGDLTLIDSDPTAPHKFKVNGKDPWVLDETGGTETVCGGIITGGTGSRIDSAGESNTISDDNICGGGAVIEKGGKLTMTGGNIVGCTAAGKAAFGGGVFVRIGGTFNMFRGSITGCTAAAQGSDGSAYGGGIRNNGFDSDVGRTTLSGTAVIRDCHATGESWLAGGGISDGGTLNISGDVTIIGCTAGGKSDAMYVNGNNDSSITGGTFYGSIMDNGGKITGITVKYHLNSNENYATQVLQSGDTTGIPDPAKSGYTFDGWYKTDGTKWDTTTPVTENLTLIGWLYKGVKTADEFTDALDDTTIDVIRMEKNITLDGDTVIKVTNGRKVILDLNGYVLDLAGKYISVSTADAFKRVENRLAIMDSRPTAEHKFKDNGTGLWVQDETGGDKLVKGGIITGGINDIGGAINVGQYGKFIMNGGNIVGCSATYGGAVCIDISGLAFEMNGGCIMGCKADFYGGAVYMYTGTFTMTGGSIADCTAANGSGVCLEGGTMNAGGGTVDGTVVLKYSSGYDGGIQGSGTTFSGLIINNNAQARFSGAHSPLGIVGEKPIGANGHNYCTVTFDPADGTMEHTTRYFLQGKNISGEIKPDPRTGYIFAGWYNGENAWNHDSDTVTADMTLTAHWTACDHSGHTGAQPTCTDTATCTACNGTIPALGHDWGAWSSNNDGTHTRICKRDNMHTETKDCSGGEATCREKAVCADCKKAYGSLDPANHKEGRQEWAATAATHEKKWSCCGAVTVAGEAHEWVDGVCHECEYVCLHDDMDKNHICDYCNAVLSECIDADNDHLCDLCGKVLSDHTGGTATCKDKAMCEICGEAYGELAEKNHANLVHVPAKAATKDAGGNIEYWYCEGCGKYYPDAKASKEITKADIVTPKLPSDPKSPQTGDSSKLMLWIALLFTVSGAVIGTTVVSNKKKKNK